MPVKASPFRNYGCGGKNNKKAFQLNATFPLCTDTNENITLPTSFSGVKCKIIEQSKHFRDKKKIKPKTVYDEYKMFLETYKTVNVKEVVRTTFAHLNLFTLKKQLRKK